jgi:hypothetical protein
LLAFFLFILLSGFSYSLLLRTEDINASHKNKLIHKYKICSKINFKICPLKEKWRDESEESHWLMG